MQKKREKEKKLKVKMGEVEVRQKLHFKLGVESNLEIDTGEEKRGGAGNLSIL